MENQEVAFIDVVAAQGSESLCHESAPQASAAMGGGYGEMVNQAATTIMSAKDGCDQSVIFSRDQAEPGIALEEPIDTWS
jgi:hypothetical protein